MTSTRQRYDRIGRRIPERTARGVSRHARSVLPPKPGDWVEHAACVGHDPELWFPPPGGRAPQARAICNACPVQRDCAAYVLLYPQCGVWGGLTENQRRQPLHQSRRNERR